MKFDPLEQFDILTILDIRIAGYNVSFSNSALFMGIVVALIYALLHYGMRNRAIVPGRLQAAAEMFYEFVANMVRENAGPDAKPFFPLVFGIFMFVLFGNLIGLIPFTFTFTSHIIVTFSLAMLVFVFVTGLAIVKHGWRFFTFFMPHGVPLTLAPILVPIEVISYLIRPVSLSVRLFANMMAGHTMLAVFASFTALLIYNLGGAGWAIGVLPVALNVVLTGFEILVAALQAFVFSILTCLYIHDALYLH